MRHGSCWLLDPIPRLSAAHLFPAFPYPPPHLVWDQLPPATLSPHPTDPTMSRIARKRMHTRIRKTYNKFHLSRRTKDLDQIESDLKKVAAGQQVEAAYHLETDDLPAGGDHYCAECARYFVNAEAKQRHQASKVHRRRLKDLKEGAFTQKESEEATGLKTDNTQRRSKTEDASMAS